MLPFVILAAACAPEARLTERMVCWDLEHPLEIIQLQPSLACVIKDVIHP
jgi:hypothetical protein